MTIYSTGSPGMFRVGRSWTVSYTATDKAGNEAKCEFTFKLSGKYTVILILCVFRKICFPTINVHCRSVPRHNESSLLSTYRCTNPFLAAYNRFFSVLPIQKIRKNDVDFFTFSELLKN